MTAGRSFTLIRHGQTAYNVKGLLNGDPEVPVSLDDVGRRQCEAVAAELAGCAFDLAIHTRFPRTTQSLALVLDGREVPVAVYPELDDVRLGIFEGRNVTEYRAWRREHTPADPPPRGGESRLGVLGRYLRGFERMVAEPAHAIVAVIHDVPIRFLANAALGADPLDGPVRRVVNGEVRRLDDGALSRALVVMRERLGG